MDALIRGDVLLRCRHVRANGQRVSMFRAAFHTGYISPGVFRFHAPQLDGASADSRYPSDFFVDLVFAPVEDREGRLGGDQAEPESGAKDASLSSGGGVKIQQSERSGRDGGNIMFAPVPTATVADTVAAVDAARLNDLFGDSTIAGAVKGDGGDDCIPGNLSYKERITDLGLVLDEKSRDVYDHMIHRDSRFWDAIISRSARCSKVGRRSRKFLLEAQERFSICDTEGEAVLAGDEGDRGRGGDSGGSGDCDSVISLGASSMVATRISDWELITQLAMAEQEPADGCTHHNLSKELTSPAAIDDHTSSGAADPPGEFNVSEGGDLRASYPEQSHGGGQRPRVHRDNTPADKELMALDSLEKELGLDNVHGSDSSVSSQRPTTANYSFHNPSTAEGSADAKSREDEVTARPGESSTDDLEELEMYLQSLSATQTAPPASPSGTA
eukprot:gene983-1110_t